MRDTIKPTGDSAKSVTIPSIDELKPIVLGLIAKSNGLHESTILETIFPQPAFPGLAVDEVTKEAWRQAQREWTTAAYGGEGVAYRDSYASACSAATIALTKEGKINEHNNGYASYSFTVKR